MADIIVPSDWLAPVLDDPFGIKILETGAGHAASNRYFAHQTLRIYFQYIPEFVQAFLPPIDALYFSNALFLWLTHFFLLVLIAGFIAVHFNSGKYHFIFAAAAISSLFHSNGYHNYMGIISSSVSYTSAYAFGMVLLFLFCFPFFRQLLNPTYKFSAFQKAGLFLLMIVLAFNGPIIPPVSIIICSLIISYLLTRYFKLIKENDVFAPYFQKSRHNAKSTIILLSFFILLCLYSFYIGTFNAENSQGLSLAGRYQMMFGNIIPFLTQKLGLPLLLLSTLINIFFLCKQEQNSKSTQILKQTKWLLAFAVIYLLLLPLGGYRSYRAGIIRHDTFLPITLALVYYFGLSSVYLWHQFQLKYRNAYRFGLVVCLTIFTIADEPHFDKNHCEKAALEFMSQSNKSKVQLSEPCTVMSWEIIRDPVQSELNAQLLFQFGITKDTVLYFYK